MALNAGVYAVNFIQGEVVVATGTFTLGGDSEVVGPVEFQATATHVQWRSPVGSGTWNNLMAISALPQGPVGPAGADGADGTNGTNGAEVELRQQGDWLQWKLTTAATWNNLFDTSTLSGGGGGGEPGPSTTIIVRGQYVNSADMNFVPTGDPVTDTQNLQTFVNNIATDRVIGVMARGQWEINGQIKLPNGVRLHGAGRNVTILNCNPAFWTQSHFTPLRMDTSSNSGNINDRGFWLADFTVIGADKNRSDSGGGLIRLHGFTDGLIERVQVEDPSSYGIFIAGYGPGSFSNDITLPSWNATHRVTVRDCVAYRGQIGFGTEGGAEHVLFDRCVAIGYAGNSPTQANWGLHGFRSASGYDVTLRKCRVVGYRNGYLIDRYRNVHVDGCYFDQVRNGLAPGSFYTSDPEISHDLRITNNYIDAETENGVQARAINDDYVGSGRILHGLTIQGNIIKNGNMVVNRSRQVNITGNVALNSTSVISCGSSVTGRVHGNTMNVSSAGGTLTNFNGYVGT